MKYILMISAAITAIGSLSVVIDHRSQLTAERPERALRQGPFLISAPGRIEGMTEEIQLRAQLHGRIASVAVEEGDHVSESHVLLRIDDEQYRHELSLAAAELDNAKTDLERLLNGARDQEIREADATLQAKLARLEQAQRRWERTSDLRGANVVSQEEADDDLSLYEALKAEVEAAQARADLLKAPPRQEAVQIAEAAVRAAEARAKLARMRMERTELRAPVAGRVLKVNVNPGELTGPDSQQPAIIVADTSHCRVRAFVEELDAPRVRVGLPAKVTADGIPGTTFNGRVVRLSPRMERKELWTDDPAEHYDTKVRQIWIELDDTEDLVVGLRVDVTIDPTSDAENEGAYEATKLQRAGPGPKHLRNDRMSQAARS